MSNVIDRDEYLEKIQGMLNLFRAGEVDYRPLSDSGEPGGIIELKEGIPTIVVPDLHGRYEFLERLLQHEMDGKSILELLSLSSIQIVCVGDAFHSESRGKKRWLECYKEYVEDFKSHSHIDEEMFENLKTMEYIMELKFLFPGYFHFLKGNHENIKNEEGGGDYPFGKYTSEGEIVHTWVYEFMGNAFLDSYAKMEKLFPIMAVGDGIIISHTLPKTVYKRAEVINYHNNDTLINEFIWNRPFNDPDETIEGYFKEYLGESGGVYVVGHSPVRGRGEFLADNRFVKIHNPDNMYVLYHNREKGLNNIIDLNGESHEKT